MSGTRGWITAAAVCVALCSSAARAGATTIDVNSTLASAGCLFGVGSQNPLSATCSNANAGGTLTGAAIADVPAGHLGASASSKVPGTASGAGSFYTIGLSVSDAEPGDSLLFTLLLDGSYSVGGGGTFQLIYDVIGDGGEVIDNAAISCNTFNDLHHGTSCWQAATSGSTGAAGNSVQFNLPINGVDSIGLTGILTVSTGPNGTATAGVSADFYNSALLTITVPTGTVIQGNPGGVLFQQPGAPTPVGGTVPEPASLVLVGTGALALARRFRNHHNKPVTN